MHHDPGLRDSLGFKKILHLVAYALGGIEPLTLYLQFWGQITVIHQNANYLMCIYARLLNYNDKDNLKQ